MLSNQRINQLNKLISKTGLHLKKYDLLNSALVHPSYVFEKGSQVGNHNQRLEFLGDAVVGLIVGDYLFHRFPEKGEGELTKMRAAIVCESSLAKAANRLEIGRYLLMGKGEKIGGGATRSSNLADAFEALVGAFYIDLGLDAIRTVVLDFLKTEI